MSVLKQMLKVTVHTVPTLHIYVMMEPIYPLINVFLYVMHESQAVLALYFSFLICNVKIISVPFA